MNDRAVGGKASTFGCDAIADVLPADPICVRISAAVKITGIGRSTLYELIGAGDIETVKIGRSTFILYASLRRLFEKR